METGFTIKLLKFTNYKYLVNTLLLCIYSYGDYIVNVIFLEEE